MAFRKRRGRSTLNSHPLFTYTSRSGSFVVVAGRPAARNPFLTYAAARSPDGDPPSRLPKFERTRTVLSIAFSLTRCANCISTFRWATRFPAGTRSNHGIIERVRKLISTMRSRLAEKKGSSTYPTLLSCTCGERLFAQNIFLVTGIHASPVDVCDEVIDIFCTTGTILVIICVFKDIA